MKVKVKINNELKELEVKEGELLIEVLRREGYKGVKKGCLKGECGACAVLLNNRPVNSCLVLAADIDGMEVITIEGLAKETEPNIIQKSFVEAGAVQCGYCTPGMVISTKALLDRISEPTDEEIKKALEGNLCRCTGYVKIIDAVKLAVNRLKIKT